MWNTDTKLWTPIKHPFNRYPGPLDYSSRIRYIVRQPSGGLTKVEFNGNNVDFIEDYYLPSGQKLTVVDLATLHLQFRGPGSFDKDLTLLVGSPEEWPSVVNTIYRVDYAANQLVEHDVQFTDDWPDYYDITKIDIDRQGNIWIVAGLARKNIYVCWNGTSQFVEVNGGWQIIGDLGA